ncbi:MAG: hypothetical protein A2075_19845 [Geobacteraceae bacterium GWC2_58_44]|nr:MAG: hypothetical protein A2075_19845 [Geobacteraceae bacterium GWC2_58_44]
MSLGFDRYAIRNLRGLLFRLNLVLSGCALAFFAWNLTSYLKELALEQYSMRLNSWATPFYHPQDASLINYVVLCLCMGVYGLMTYFKAGGGLRYLLMKRRTLGNRFPLLLIPSSLLFLIVVNRHWESSNRLLVSLYLMFVLFVPWSSRLLKPLCKKPGREPRLWRDRIAPPYQWGARYGGAILLTLTLVVWCVLAVEPIRLIKGPVYVLNEFRDIYSATRIGDEYVDNKLFLEREEIKGPRAAKFVKANALEYVHQTNTRGQLHHIGHILNPLNEHASGKPLPDVYMQYGWGNTLLYKYTMELFGGASIDNFYKCYIYYILYSVLFAAMLLYLFRDGLFVFCGSVFYAICFYSCSYLIFIIAPGIIPTIHFFDTTVLLLLTLYFRRSNPGYLLPAVLLSAFSMYMNRQFGLVLFLAMSAAALLYLWENKRGKERYLLSSAVVLLPFVVLAAPVFETTVNSSSTLLYFLTGFLSFKPSSDAVFLTVLYLVVSFQFLFLIRKQTHPLKYAFVFAFVYSLGLLTYFYWSGLSNHLGPVLPFVGVELLLMLRLAKELLPSSGKGRSVLAAGMVLAAASLAYSYGSTIKYFYRDKKVYDANFTQHAVYQWEFERARIVTTINPEPLRESISLIHKYSPRKGDGIYLLSSYDKLLPFLADRYSLMPFFEMQWYLFTPKERAQAVSRLTSSKPEYLFVENDIAEVVADPWELYFDDLSINNERRSNQQRRLELAKVFAAVEDAYEKVDQGPLLSVYRRKSLQGASAEN